MHEPAFDSYVAAFVSRCSADAQPMLGVPGLYGATSSSDHPFTRLLVTSDDAYEELAAVLPSRQAGTISVFVAATRCTRLVADRAEWKPTTANAMTCQDLSVVPEPVLPNDLTLHRVRRLPDDSPEGVELQNAVSLAKLADRSATESPAALAAYLQSLSPAFRLFAAIDDDGVVRATSGCGVFGSRAVVIFVNTDPDRRRRGLGQTMTAAALHDARDAGATRASLDASGAGLSIYRRLGFEDIARITRFSTSN